MMSLSNYGIITSAVLTDAGLMRAWGLDGRAVFGVGMLAASSFHTSPRMENPFIVVVVCGSR